MLITFFVKIQQRFSCWYWITYWQIWSLQQSVFTK